MILPEVPVEATARTLMRPLAVGQTLASLGRLHLPNLETPGAMLYLRAAELKDGLGER
jgi:hypothetical protein